MKPVDTSCFVEALGRQPGRFPLHPVLCLLSEVVIKYATTEFIQEEMSIKASDVCGRAENSFGNMRPHQRVHKKSANTHFVFRSENFCAPMRG
jgi:hypothetical protein